MTLLLGVVSAGMTKITTGASVSLDGYISGPGESGFEHLFAWYGGGTVEIETTNPELTFRLSETDAQQVRAIIDEIGCFVVGRKLFDLTNGWGGRHTLGIHCVVLTHSVPEGWQDDEHYTFVTDGGIERAVQVARGIAGDKDVGLNGGTIASQALDAGLVDEIGIDLVPVILGGGTPFFASLGNAPFVLEGPIANIQGERVTHLRYVVTR
jgi:dihydrofolate reductase